MTAPSPPAASLSAMLSNVRVAMRDDLETSRHVFRGTASYILRDPITFQSQRLEIADYQILVSITPDRTLGEIFRSLVADGALSPEDETSYFQFILALHGLGFLRLPIADHASLHRRYVQRERARRKERWMGVLFLRIPLWNPSAFLDRTYRFAAPFCTLAFFGLWAILVVSAGWTAVRNADRLLEPTEGLFTAGNLPVLWLTLIVLKALHEFGHAFACRHFGGQVPEMGAYMILFTPCAYVDATASWGFPQKRNRILVCLAGMYVELFLAAAATLIWAATEASFVHSVAYNVMFLSSVVTVLFNANPLMRYDGYYVLSDWLEIPNLKEQSSRALSRFAKRLFLGIGVDEPKADRRKTIILLAFGLSASAYRVTVLFAISAAIASKILFAGVAIAIGYAGAALWGMVMRLRRFLFQSPETAAVRGRAMALGVLLLVALPAALFLIPVPSHLVAGAILLRERESLLRAGGSGFLIRGPIPEGSVVASGDELGRLISDDVDDARLDAAAKIEASEIRSDALRASDPVGLRQENEHRSYVTSAAEVLAKQQEAMTIRVEHSGRLAWVPEWAESGSFVPQGAPVAEVVGGGWIVAGELTSGELSRARTHVGQSVTFEPLCTTMPTISGIVEFVSPMGRRELTEPALSTRMGGSALVDPISGIPIEPLFTVRVRLDAAPDAPLLRGMRGGLRFSAKAEPLGATLIRRVHHFFVNLSRES